MKLPFTPSTARLLALALLSVGLAGTLRAQATSPSPSAQGKKVLYVCNPKGQYVPEDNLGQKELKNLGFAVTVGDQKDPASISEGSDLIVISSTVSARTVWAKYRDVKIPVMTWEPFIQPHMGMTGMKMEKDWGENEHDEQINIWLVNAPHPMQAGLPNGLTLPWTESVKILSWGHPGPAAQVVATMPGEPQKALIYGYEKGALMDYDFPAPARRVFFFLTNDTVSHLGPNGWKLYDAAMLWAIGSSAK